MNFVKNFDPRGSQLLIIISAILVINLVLTNSISYVTMKKNIKKSIIENDLPVHSALVYSEIKQELQPPIIASATLADNFFLKKWLKEGEKDPEFINRYLESIRKQYGGMTCFLVSEKTKTYYNMQGAFPIAENDVDAQWYFDFRNEGKQRSINCSINVDMDNMPTAFINYRILSKDGETLGVSGIGLRLSTIPKLLSRYSKDLERDIYFASSEGKIIARSSDAIIKSESLSGVVNLRDSLEKILSDENSIYEFSIGNEPFIMQSMYLPELGWWLINIQRESITLNKMNRMIYSVIAINIVTILLTLLLVFFSVNIFQKRLKSMAMTDALTGISNRQIFELSLKKAFIQYKRRKLPFSLLIIDIDFFKKINDSLGHLEGDQVLIKTVETIKNNIRKSDEFSRWGGEEFIVLASDCNHSQAIDLAEKIRSSIEDSNIARYPDGSVLTISIGVSEIKENDNSSSLIQRADYALYTAKEMGRNCVIFSSSGT
ncbi:GGDEF domain-containing protein [Desulforhopalus vacuolatus]|uniref:sensor domain-containing diguanylate cyclase n=1 Tax=Desulforhopalus vacuolatus TaxID=40414 RepID=UPI0019637435|nr:diguanylate cyclase [Desulforhopalus vacuolatus]MBM9518921.1 GGDEF domain-containing protein [Desulforhopalus vacuolatus]